MLRMFALSLLCAVSLSAQTSDRIQGYVADQTGARIPAAAVSLHAVTGNWKESAVTSADGTFIFLRPPAGKLELRVTHAGLQEHKQIVDMEINGGTDLPVVLSAASLQQAVQVAGESAMLQPNAATQSATISTKEMESLPTASRNYTHLIVSEAGV